MTEIAICEKHRHFSSDKECLDCLLRSHSTAFDVTSEFIEQQKRLAGKEQPADLVKPKHKFAPYTKAERGKRRKDVFHLHLELGMPAIRIAEILKVDRNTVNSDLKAIYRSSQDPATGLDEDYQKFRLKMELQRVRLIQYLNKEQDIRSKLLIERHLTDLDNKMLQATERFCNNVVTELTKVALRVNKYAIEKNLDWRTINLSEIVRLSPEGYKSFENVLRREGVIR